MSGSDGENSSTLRAQISDALAEVHVMNAAVEHVKATVERVAPVAMEAGAQAKINGDRQDHQEKRIDGIVTDIKSMREANVASFREIGLQQDEAQRDSLLLRSRLEDHIDASVQFADFAKGEFTEIKDFLKPIAERRTWARLTGKFAKQYGKPLRSFGIWLLVIWGFLSAVWHAVREQDASKLLELLGVK